MDSFNAMLVNSSSADIQEKLNSGDYYLEISQGRPFISMTGSNRVVCICNEEVNGEERSPHFINRAKDFFESLTPELREYAIESIVMSESDRLKGLLNYPEGFVDQDCANVLAPNTKRLNQYQVELLKVINNNCKQQLYFNSDFKAITSLDQRSSYVPNRFGGFTKCSKIVPLKHFKEISAQWDAIPLLKHLDAHPDFTDQALRHHSLPKPDRRKDVKSIETVVDYVAGGDYRPLVIFDVDDTLVTKDVTLDQKLERIPLAKNTAEIMTRIRQKSPNAKIILLTQATLSSTHEKLKETGISRELFDSILSVSDSGGDKGEVFIHYIENMQQMPDQVCFVDDTEYFLDLIEQACKKYQISCNTFHFAGADGAIERRTANALKITVEEYRRDYVH